MNRGNNILFILAVFFAICGLGGYDPTTEATVIVCTALILNKDKK